jgi:hypothetical protein
MRWPMAESAGVDCNAVDLLIPHPAYATQAWVAVLNPGETTWAPAVHC